MCACVVYACVCTRWVPWPWVYACRGERLTLGIFLICSPPTFFETRSLTQLRARKSARVAGQQALRSTYLCSPPQCWAHPHTLQVFLHTVTISTQVLMLTEHVLHSWPRLEIEIAIFFQKYSQKHNIHKQVLFFFKSESSAYPEYRENVAQLFVLKSQ